MGTPYKPYSAMSAIISLRDVNKDFTEGLGLVGAKFEDAAAAAEAEQLPSPEVELTVNSRETRNPAGNLSPVSWRSI